MTVYLEDKRADLADVATKVQHVCGGLPLLVFGFEKRQSGEEISIALLEITIALVVLGAFALEMRQLRRRLKSPSEHHDHPVVGWFDLAAGLLLLFEAFHGQHHKPGYLRPQFYSGVATLGLGVFHARLHSFRKHRRYLTMDETGLDCRPSPLLRFGVPWGDLAAIELRDNSAIFRRKDSRAHTLLLRVLRNAEKVRDALQQHPRTATLLN